MCVISNFSEDSCDNTFFTKWILIHWLTYQALCGLWIAFDLRRFTSDFRATGLICLIHEEKIQLPTINVIRQDGSKFNLFEDLRCKMSS